MAGKDAPERKEIAMQNKMFDKEKCYRKMRNVLNGLYKIGDDKNVVY